ncbi:cytochrome P450 [Gordonia sp. NPDC003376]
MSQQPAEPPAYDVDYYGDDVILDPYPHYRAMRDLGPVVALPQVGTYAVTRYDDIREVLREWETYSSAQGVAGDEAACAYSRGNTLQSDPPRHDVLRSKLIGPLLPGALEQVRPRIQRTADDLVEKLLVEGGFDGMDDFARVLPLTIVRELVGLPDEGRDSMLSWASAAFDLLGAQNERGKRAKGVIMGMQQWIATHTSADRLREGSWTARIREMEARGEVDADMTPHLILAYIGPSLDTTISATGELLYQLGRNPHEWEKLRNDPSLVGSAVQEAVRMCTPIRSFTRKVVKDTELAGTRLAEGSRVTLMFASANRDGRKYVDPDEFHVDRNPHDHLGFGHGIHMCAGMHLARLEMECLLRAMIPRVGRIEVGEPRIAVNNTIRAFETLPTRFHANPDHGIPRPVVTGTVVAGAGPSIGTGVFEVRIVERTPVAVGVLAFGFERVDGGALPDFEPGAHIDVEVRPGTVRQYSLCGDIGDTERYRIAVKLEAESRGGSASLHRDLQIGDTLTVSKPRNLFRLDEEGPRPVLFAAGIGITPILPMVRRLYERGADFVLHYSARSREHAAFIDELSVPGLTDHVRMHISEGDVRMHISEGDVRMHISDGPGGGRLDIRAALEQLGRESTIYVCGPGDFTEAVMSEATDLGWDEDRMVVERFTANSSSTDTPFTLMAARSGRSIEVPSGLTALEALERAGIPAPSSCRAGVCATCLTRVVDGIPDHRDLVQTDAEKMTDARMALCCSRSLTPELVLDI